MPEEEREEREERLGKGAFSLFLGVLGLFLSFLWGIGLVPSAIGIVLAILAKREGLATGNFVASVIVCALGVIVSIIFIIFFISFISNPLF